MICVPKKFIFRSLTVKKYLLKYKKGVDIMSIKDTDRKARANYRKKIVELRVPLFPTDEDIKAKLNEIQERGESKAEYVRRLIREDMQKGETI